MKYGLMVLFVYPSTCQFWTLQKVNKIFKWKYRNHPWKPYISLGKGLDEKWDIFHATLNSNSALKLVMLFLLDLHYFYSKTVKEIFILQMKKLRFNKIKWLAKDDTGDKKQEWDCNPSLRIQVLCPFPL